MKKAIAICF